MVEIQQTLKRYKADKFGFIGDEKRVAVAFEAYNRQVRFILPLPQRSDFKTTWREKSANAAQKRYEQAVRSKWRALLLTIKAKLESVESGIETFEAAFMAQLVLPTGETMEEWAAPQLKIAFEQQTALPPLLGSGN